MFIDIPHGLSEEHARMWSAFVLWCAATGHDHLPVPGTTPDRLSGSSAAALCAHLASRPRDSAVTRRARVTAINAAYRAYGHPPPGAAESVRRLLNPDRADRYARVSARVDTVLPDIAIHGWPTGVHGRRDGALLVLAAAGLSFPVLAGLRQSDVEITDDEVVVGSQPLVVLPATGDHHRCPVRVMRRWAAIVRLIPHHLAAAALEVGLTTRTPLLGEDDFMPGFGENAVFTGFDARGRPTGHVGTVDHVSADHLARIVAVRLTGAPPVTLAPLDDPDEPVFDEPETTLDPGAYARGVAAKARARDAGDDIAALLDRLDALIDDVTERTEWTLSYPPL